VIELAVNSANATCALRSLVYASFVEAFEYPGPEMLDAIRSGAFAVALQRLLEALDPCFVDGMNWDALRDEDHCDDDLLAEYTRLFIAGADGPACALEEGVHLRTSFDAMEESLRFYKHFGLSLPDDRQEQPDHLKTELEFLHYLTYQEAQAVSEGAEVEGLRRAQCDFINRHAGAWVPILREKLVASEAMPFFIELARLLERYLESETRRLSQMADAAGRPDAMQ
jgi:DMSO reductase family type II enzyme chaperone